MAETLTAPVEHRGFGMAPGVEHVPNKRGDAIFPPPEKLVIELPDTLKGVLDKMKEVNAEVATSEAATDLKAKKISQLGRQLQKLGAGIGHIEHTVADLRGVQSAQNAHAKNIRLETLGRHHPEVKETVEELASINTKLAASIKTCESLTAENTALKAQLESKKK